MLPTPTCFMLAAGAAEGPTPLNAFDNALLAAGLGNVNLLKISSVLPPGARREERLAIPPGSLVPTAYGYVVGEEPGERLAAAVAVGVQRDGFGIIMEFAGRCGREEAEEAARAMVRAAFARRGIPLHELHACGVEHRVERIGCAFAAVALGYGTR